MNNFFTGLGEDLNSKFTARFIIIVLAAMLFFSVTGKAQSSITLYFAPSSTELDSGAIVSIFRNFEVDSVHAYANSLTNSNGMSNRELCEQRLFAVMDILDESGVMYGFHGKAIQHASDSAEYRKVVIYVRAKNDMPLANKEHSTIQYRTLANDVCRQTAEAEYLAQMERDMSRSTTVVEPVRVSRVNERPSSHVSSLISEVSVLDRQAPANLYTLNELDIAVRQTMAFGLDTASNHIDKSMIRNKGMNESKKLRRRMRLMMEMWIKHDAIPSANELKEGAVFGNGNSYKIAATWTPTGVSAKRQAIEKYGDQIPWLGWDKKAYKEYWADHSVFPDVEKEATNPLAQKMSYKSNSQILSDKERAKIKREKARKYRQGLRKDRAEKRRLKRIKRIKKLTSCLVAAKRALGLVY